MPCPSSDGRISDSKISVSGNSVSASLRSSNENVSNQHGLNKKLDNLLISMQLVQKPTTQEKKNLIEETFRGNTVTQSIEDETKAQDFSP